MKKNIMFRQLIWTITLGVCFFCSQISAVEVKDLYQAKIELASQSKKNRTLAQRMAIKQVLVKIAGSAAITNNSYLRAAINKPSNYLKQFSYIKDKGQMFLLASFEQQKVNKLLQQAQVGIWGKHRPLTTIWLIKEKDQKRSLIGDLTDSDAKNTIDAVAFNRGVPINYPLYDLDDLMSVSSTDVWGRFGQTIISGSERYLAQSVVNIRISYNTLVDSDCDNCSQLAKLESTDNEELVVDWILWFNGKNFQNSYQGRDEKQLLTRALNDIADTLFENNSFVLAENDQGIIDIELLDVTSMQQFVEISTFFNELSLVSDVRLISTIGTKMTFRLNISADVEAVKQALKLESKLESMEEYFEQDSVPQPITYRWKG